MRKYNKNKLILSLLIAKQHCNSGNMSVLGFFKTQEKKKKKGILHRNTLFYNQSNVLYNLFRQQLAPRMFTSWWSKHSAGTDK